uniref:Uncharacterized protein n=1 Tax=Arundo donax TaxID=35708 RepID=A0A0A9A951_ARUDO
MFEEKRLVFCIASNKICYFWVFSCP